MNRNHPANRTSSPIAEASTPQSPDSVVRKVCQFLLDTLTKTNQPTIWSTCDRSGQVWRHVYDPTTGLSSDLIAE